MSEETQTQETQETQAHWTKSLTDVDMQNNPTMQKYASQEDAHRGHLELVKSFGKDKVVLPTADSTDIERAAFNERLGVPKDAAGYNLENVKMNESAGVFNKGQFQDQMLEAGARPEVAAKLWASYTEMIKGAHSDHETKFNEGMQRMQGELRQKWGEAYDTKIERGQAVVDSFADSQEHGDWLMAQIGSDARGQMFLAKLGDQFAESSIAGFQEKQTFTLTPDEAKSELATIKASQEYKSDNIRIRQPAIDRANELMQAMNKR